MVIKLARTMLYSCLVVFAEAKQDLFVMVKRQIKYLKSLTYMKLSVILRLDWEITTIVETLMENQKDRGVTTLTEPSLDGNIVGFLTVTLL